MKIILRKNSQLYEFYYLQLSTSSMRVHHESMLPSHIYGHS